MIKSYVTSDGKRVGNYLLTKKLGEGQFGEIYLAKNIHDGHQYAVKQIDKAKIDCNNILKRLLKTEISIMHDISHPNILHLYEHLESTNNYYLVLDYCNQGHFRSYMDKKGLKYMDESNAVYYLKQIANGFQELRKYRILHRDVKLENFFVNNDILIIGDFGFAKRGVDMAQTKLGTPLTMAYELLDESSYESYDAKADLWSIGAVYYEMLFGDLPFQGDDIPALRKDILRKANGKLTFSRNVSFESRDLINRILVTDPKKRMGWDEFFHHPLFDKFKVNIDDETLDVFKALGQVLMDSRSSVEAQFNQNKKQANFFDKYSNQQVFLNQDNILNYNSTKHLNTQNVVEEFFNINNTAIIEKQLEFKEINFRYMHECGIERFYVYSIKKLQKIIKDGYFNNLNVDLFDGIILLFKKTLYINNTNLESLQYSKNIYNLNSKYFNESKSSLEYQNLIAEFSTDRKDLTGYINLTMSRIEQIKVTPRFYSLLNDNFNNMNFINEQLVKLQNYLKQKIYGIQISESVIRDFYYTIAVVKFSAESERRFPYMKDINNTFTRFNWDNFYNSFDSLTLNDLKRIV